MKRILTKEEVYGGSAIADNLIDDKYIYYDDLTCLEICNENELKFYKLVNPFSIDIPIYKMKKILHKEDGPAYEKYNNSETIYIWYKDDKRHREDGPAYERTTATGDVFQEWYINGKRHREDGPAAISPNTNIYYIEDKLHRIDGPAIECKIQKSEKWYINGILHRTDGPAVIEGDNFAYYENGLLHRLDGPAKYEKTIYHETRTEYRVEGLFHRTDGPALYYVSTDGTIIEEYRIDNKYHRLDGPAYLKTKDDEILEEGYYNNDRRHRIDGPAYYYKNCWNDKFLTKEYYIDGKQYSYWKFWCKWWKK